MTIVQERSASVRGYGARAAAFQDTGLRSKGPGAANAVLYIGRRCPSKRCLFAARLRCHPRDTKAPYSHSCAGGAQRHAQIRSPTVNTC